MSKMRYKSKRLLRAAVLGCLLAAGEGAAADGEPRAPMRVWAIGLPNGYVLMEHQAPVLHITAEDVARGEVEVHSGTRIAVATSSPGGFAADFQVHSPMIRATGITGIGNPVEIGARGGTAIEPATAASRRSVTIDYCFVLAPDARPGSYPWPLEIAVRALPPEPGGAESFRPLSAGAAESQPLAARNWASPTGEEKNLGRSDFSVGCLRRENPMALTVIRAQPNSPRSALPTLPADRPRALLRDGRRALALVPAI